MDKQRVKEFAGRVFTDMAGAMAAGMGYLGTQTGLFRAMAGQGPMQLDQVVAAAGLQTRYVEEWLKGMVAAGYLDHDPEAESFELPDEHAFLVASEGTDHFMGGLFHMAPVLMQVAPRVATAFTEGGGVPFTHYGPEGVAALDLINRGQYEHRLTGEWLTALPEITERLADGGRVLDVGCGVGRVCLALAQAFPHADIVGIDPDAGSIERAVALAQEEGLSERIRFIAKTTTEFEPGDGFDLITACDCVHDFTAPQQTLDEIRSLLKSDGVLFVVEPKVADDLLDNRNPVATMFYGFSLFHCMTQSLADGGPGLGTCLGPAGLTSLLRDAGFSRVDTLPIRSQVNHFYAARP